MRPRTAVCVPPTVAAVLPLQSTARFELYFGDYNDAAVKAVIEIYRAALAALDGDTVITDHVENMDVQADLERTHAWSKMGDGIHLAHRFWRSDAEKKPLTLLHEATHVARDTTDESGFGERNAIALAEVNPAGARMCAYNYEYFAQHGATRRKGEASSEPEPEESSEESSEEQAEAAPERERSSGDNPIAIWEDERRFAIEMIKLSQRYVGPEASAREKARLKKEWDRREQVLFRRWGMNARAYTLWLDTSQIGVRVPVPPKPE